MSLLSRKKISPATRFFVPFSSFFVPEIILHPPHLIPVSAPDLEVAEIRESMSGEQEMLKGIQGSVKNLQCKLDETVADFTASTVGIAIFRIKVSVMETE